jgi:hypothetical protein
MVSMASTSCDIAVPRYCTLNGFAEEASRAAGVDLSTLAPITRLRVRTRNSLYLITVRDPHQRTVLVRGGSFFPETTDACLSGSSFGGSLLKIAWVGVGLHMEFYTDGARIVTSRVESIAVEDDATIAGPF